MDTDLNKLVSCYEKANLEYIDIYHMKIPSGSFARNQTTGKDICGIVIPIRGRAEFSLNTQTCDLQEGVILHAGAQMSLSKKVIGDSEWEYIVLHYRVLGGEEEKAFLDNLYHAWSIGAGQNAQIHSLVRQLQSSQKGGNILNSYRSKVLLYSLIEVILQAAQLNQMDSDEELIHHVVAYIHAHIDKNMTIFSLAEKFHMDSKRFNYLFHKVMGMCPKRYITQCIINNAKEILANWDYSITDVAKMVGYEDAFQFSRIFKKYTGLSPSLFREEFVKNS